jgi:predicted MFS family arabinose efflux permease
VKSPKRPRMKIPKIVPDGAMEKIALGTLLMRDPLLLGLLCIWVLATNFAYYVTLVPFGLLHHMRDSVGMSEAAMRLPLIALTLSGIAAALVSGLVFDRVKNTKIRFAVIAVISALLAFLAKFSFALKSHFTILFAALGFLLGVQIVLILGVFATNVPSRFKGIFGGAAAGLAYLIANMTVAFSSGPVGLGGVDMGLAASCAAAIFLFSGIVKAPYEEQPGAPDGTLLKALAATLPLALLIAADSFTFLPLGQSDYGPNPIFSGPAAWMTNGMYHLLFSVVCGLYYFRWGRHKVVAVAAAALLASAIALYLNLDKDLTKVVHPLYSMSVGCYTVALFAMFDEIVPAKRPMLGIALCMILAGWIANPFGVGLSQWVSSTYGLRAMHIVAIIAAAPVFLATLAPIALAMKAKKMDASTTD